MPPWLIPAAAAALILVLIGLRVMLSRSGSTPVAPYSSSSEPRGTAPIDPPPATAPSTGDPFAAVQARITTAVASGDLAGALRELQGLPNTNPNDPAVTGITTVVVGAARSAAQAAAAAAEAAGASRNPSDVYKNGVAQRDAADAAASAGRMPEAAQGYLDAARTFTEAADAAKNTPQVAQAEPAPPPPVPAPAPPQQQAPPQRQPERQATSRPADTASIQTLLQQYAEAYAKMDAQALRTVWPGAPAAFSFAGNRSYTMNLRNPQLQWNGDKPTVTAVRHTIQELENGQKREASVPITITLRRISGGWVIDTIQ